MLKKPTKLSRTHIRFLVDSSVGNVAACLVWHSDASPDAGISLRCPSNSPHRFWRSLFPFHPSHVLFSLVFTGFLPSCAWSIKHTCVLAPSPRQPLVSLLKPNCALMLSWWNSIDSRAFPNSEKVTLLPGSVLSLILEVRWSRCICHRLRVSLLKSRGAVPWKKNKKKPPYGTFSF